MLRAIIQWGKDTFGGGGRDQQLPGVYTNSHRGSSVRGQNGSGGWWFQSKKGIDGSAAGIHTAPTLQQVWQRAGPAVRISWMSVVASLVMFWMGFRWIRYSNAGLTLNCNSISCDVKIRPIGWGRSVLLAGLARDQVESVHAVKTTPAGTFVTDQNIQLHEPYDRDRKRKPPTSKYSKQSTYKGPDEKGHYLSYALILVDRGDKPPKEQNDGGASSVDADSDSELSPLPFVDLQRLHPYTERYIDAAGLIRYRLIIKQFGVAQSKRKVRTMINKIESYVKRRRQKLVIKENNPPPWQGVLLLVFGCIGFILVAVLGQFSEKPAYSGPGVRRQQGLQNKNKQKQTPQYQDPYSRSTPVRYEVASTAAAAAPTTQVSASGYRRNTTTARKRGT